MPRALLCVPLDALKTFMGGNARLPHTFTFRDVCTVVFYGNHSTQLSRFRGKELSFRFIHGKCVAKEKNAQYCRVVQKHVAPCKGLSADEKEDFEKVAEYLCATHLEKEAEILEKTKKRVQKLRAYL